MLGQLEERLGAIEAARATYAVSLRQCPECVYLWIAAARLEERNGAVGKARAMLEQSRLKNPQNEHLWLAAIRTEARAGNVRAAEVLMSKALQECSNSGILWAENVATAPRPQRKARSVDALKRCHDDPFVVAAVAGLFWQDRKIDKARNWLTKAVAIEPDVGDLWAQLYKFECQHGTPEVAAEVLKRCVAAEAHHGERWQRISKLPANAHLPVETILKKVAADLDNPAP